MQRKIKILHLDTGKEFRGGQRQAEILHRGLLQNHFESYFVVNKNGKLLGRSENTIEFDYKSEISISTHKEYIKIIKEIKPDIVQTHDGHAVLFASLYKKQFGYKVVETRRVSYPISPFSRFFKYKNVDKHIAVSQDTANYLKKYFNNVVVIHSCIELNRFEIKKTPVLKNQNKVNILYVGAFSSQKGIDILIHAFNSINRDDITLHLVGDGKLLDKIKDLSNKNCIFYGRRDDIEQFYLNCDCVVVPSVDGEGSSGVIKEAIVAKKLVIASDLEANKELIKDNINGILFESKNVINLEEKLTKFIDKEINISNEELEKSSLEFDCNNLIKKYIDTYNELMENSYEK